MMIHQKTLLLKNSNEDSPKNFAFEEQEWENYDSYNQMLFQNNFSLKMCLIFLDHILQ